MNKYQKELEKCYRAYCEFTEFRGNMATSRRDFKGYCKKYKMEIRDLRSARIGSKIAITKELLKEKEEAMANGGVYRERI